MPFTTGIVSPIWPPAGIAVAGFLLCGVRVWPAVAIAAFLVNLFTPVPAYTAALIAVGNTAGPLAGAWLLRRRIGFDLSLRCLPDVLRLIVLTAFGSTAISATLGIGALSLTHMTAWSGASTAWLTWWVGDAMGVLIVTPLILTLPRARALRGARPLVELAALLILSAACSALVFQAILKGGPAQGIVLLTFPFLLVWGAVRFEVVGASLVTLCITAVAVLDPGAWGGALSVNTPFPNASLLQAFLTVIAVSGLSIAALTGERTRMIREQAERETALRGEARYLEIAETANEGVWTLDARLLTSYVNRRMGDMLGYSPDDMLGKSVVSFMFDEDTEQKRAELDRRKRGISEQLETRFRRQDGSELWVRVSTTGSFDAEGHFTGSLAMMSDITEQKRREAETKVSRRELLLLTRAVEQTDDSVVVTDERGVIKYVNPAFEKTTGYTREEAVGRTPAILKSGHHGPDFYRGLWDELLHGRTFRGTLVNRKKTGELYWAEQTITPIKDDAGEVTHFVSVLKDVTELRRKHEQEVQLRLARAVQQRFYQAPGALPGLDLAAASYPATETGGDYFDFVPAGEGCVYIAIGDASGHGFGAALVMALTRAYVRSFAALTLDVGEILTRVNAMLVADLEDNRFVTLLLLHLDARTGLVRYTSAGHVSGFILQGGDGHAVDWTMASTGPPMGMFAGSMFPSFEVRLEPSHVAVLVTDGVTESAGEGETEFGVERLVAYVGRHSDQSARDIAHGVCGAARGFAGATPQADDITSVVVKMTQVLGTDLGVVPLEGDQPRPSQAAQTLH